MTAPTREQVEEWKRASSVTGDTTELSGDALDAALALAFAAGQSSGAGSGAELVWEIEEAAKSCTLIEDNGDVMAAYAITTSNYWDRLRAALLSGDAAREDAERLEWALPILTGADSDSADARAIELGKALMQGLDGRAAIDRARGGK